MRKIRVLILKSNISSLYFLVIFSYLPILLPETEIFADEGLIDAFAFVEGVVELSNSRLCLQRFG